MNIRIICVGSIKEKYLLEGIREYAKRLTRYAKLEVVEVSDEKAPETLSAAEGVQVLLREADRIQRQQRSGAYTVVLTINGQAFSSEVFAEKLQTLSVSGASQVDFIIGGSLGLHTDLIRQADLKLSFSSFTFPHQLMRLILLEQIYRTFKIIRGEPYHK